MPLLEEVYVPNLNWYVILKLSKFFRIYEYCTHVYDGPCASTIQLITNN